MYGYGYSGLIRPGSCDVTSVACLGCLDLTVNLL